MLSNTTMSSSQRLQCLLSLNFIGLDVLYVLFFFKKKGKEKKKNFNAIMFPRFHFIGFRQLPGRIARSLERN